MSFDMRFDGLEDLIKEAQLKATEQELVKVDKKILKQAGASAKAKVSSRMLRSPDVAKSGRSTSRTYIHSADVVPVSAVKKKKGRYYVVVGWDKSDNSPYFYTKFNEWGTTARAPQPVFLPVTKEVYSEIKQLGIKEYSELLKFLEG